MNKTLFLFIFFVSIPNIAYCKEVENNEEEIIKNLSTSFSFSFEELIKEKNELKKKFSGNFSFSYPIRESTPSDNEGVKNQGRFSNNLTLNMSIKYNPVTYWFFSTTLYKYINEYNKATWNPDFSYTFGYDDWHPYTLSLVYSNYGGNRFFPKQNIGEVFTDFLGGSFNLAWKFKIPKNIEKYILITDEDSFGANISYSLVPRYFDLESLELKSFKQSARFGFRYTFFKYFYFTSTFFWYPLSNQQQPWDPDFTYGFGISDSTFSFISIQYNNYSGNRFPWNKNLGSGGIENGGFSISYSWNGL